MQAVHPEAGTALATCSNHQPLWQTPSRLSLTTLSSPFLALTLLVVWMSVTLTSLAMHQMATWSVMHHAALLSKALMVFNTHSHRAPHTDLRG